jgi:neuropeptide Y receptor
VPFTPLYTFLGTWVFGSVMCRLVASAQGVSVYISSLTLTSIAIDRFIVILYPFRPRMQVSTCVLMIILIWIFSIVAMAPYSVFIRIIPGDNGESYCSEGIHSRSSSVSYEA